MINVLFLTFVGTFSIVPIELLNNLKKILQLVGLLVGGVNGVQKIKECFNVIMKKLTGLNAY